MNILLLLIEKDSSYVSSRFRKMDEWNPHQLGNKSGSCWSFWWDYYGFADDSGCYRSELPLPSDFYRRYETVYEAETSSMEHVVNETQGISSFDFGLIWMDLIERSDLIASW